MSQLLAWSVCATYNCAPSTKKRAPMLPWEAFPYLFSDAEIAAYDAAAEDGGGFEWEEE